MTDAVSRKSYGQILALIGAIVAFSGFTSLLVSFDAQIFQINITVEQAAALQYDIQYDEDTLDERQREVVNNILSQDIVTRVPQWMGTLVYIPYALVTAFGVFALLGFRQWGRGLGFLVLLCAGCTLAIVIGIDVVIPIVIDTLTDQEMATRIEVVPTYEIGPALTRLKTGSLLGLFAAIVALVRPDRP